MTIRYGQQNLIEKDIDAVVKVLRSVNLTQGPTIELFENTVKEYTGTKFAVAVTNATAALHISCKALGLSEGDYLWTSPNSFVASANCALYCGAQIDFVDIDPETFNICVDALESKLAKAKTRDKLPKIVVPVHFGGEPAEMRRIYELSKQYNFRIIEDASHAIGAEYRGTKIGSCTYSDITVFSFHPVKIITTGEGGMALTNDKFIARKLGLLRSCTTN